MVLAMSSSPHRSAKGRGSSLNPPNRFEQIRLEDDFEQLADDDELLAGPPRRQTEYFADDSQSIVSENDSPDIFFRWSVNPYRGCAHGCSYCYARPTHEYLGLNAGLDFESKIFVKERAPELLRDWLARDRWNAELIVFSGVTDCYQPAERHFRITRGCLQVAGAARQPISIITKNALVTRDIDVLREMARRNTASVSISITTLDKTLAGQMEPRTSTPAARLGAIKMLTDAGIPTQVMVAPVIPGLNDSEIPNILREASSAGAKSAGYILLRLPLTVQPVFMEWLERCRPEAKSRVESRIRATRDGAWSESEFGKRLRGVGPIADQIANTFKVFAKKYKLDRSPAALDSSGFQHPAPSSGQLRLF